MKRSVNCRNKNYFSPSVRAVEVLCEAGFSVSNPLDDTQNSSSDFDIIYGGSDEEFK